MSASACRRLLTLVALTAVAFVPAESAAAKTPAPTAEGRDPSTILVKFTSPAVAERTVRTAGDRAVGRTPGGVHIVKVSRGRSNAEATRRYSRLPGVVYAEPNRLRRIQLDPPNDPSFGAQWGLAAIRAVDGWSIYPGLYGIALGPLVAILDTGIDSSHPDLAANVDVANGATCLTGSCTSNAALDQHGHGTHVAGIAAALTNNGVGVAGVGFASRLIPVRVLGANGQGSDASIASGIAWAVSHGARVVNLSLGGYGFSQTTCDAVAAATSAGAVVVAAAGNDGTTTPLYPAACPGAIGVAATAADGSSPEWSNWGAANVFLSAPGDAILSTYWTPSSSTYATLSGTSMATPHVAGLTALLLGQSPSRTTPLVKQILAMTADKVGADLYPPFAYGSDPHGTCACTWHPFYGYGEMDAAAALALFTPPAISATSPLVGGVGTPVTISGSGFVNVTAVKLGAKQASFVTNSSSQITATVPTDVAYGRWYVTTAAGTAASPLVFTAASPSLADVSSSYGPVGSPVVLNGSGFTAATSVTLESVAAPFVIDSPTRIRAWVPAGVTQGRWQVVSPHWTSAYPVVYTVTTTPTQSFTFSPLTAATGTSVTLKGRGFAGTTAVSFGNVPTSFAVTAPNQLTATVPAGVAYGRWRVTVGPTTFTSAVIGNVALPSIASLSHTHAASGATITITGSNLDGVTSVSLGLVETPFTVLSPTQISATVPSGVDYGRWRVVHPLWTAEEPLVFTVTS